MTIYWTPFCPDFTPAERAVSCAVVTLWWVWGHKANTFCLPWLWCYVPGKPWHCSAGLSPAELPLLPVQVLCKQQPCTLLLCNANFSFKKVWGKGNILPFLNFHTAVILQSLMRTDFVPPLSDPCNSTGSSWTSWSSCPLNEKIIVVKKNKWGIPVLLKKSQF